MSLVVYADFTAPECYLAREDQLDTRFAGLTPLLLPGEVLPWSRPRMLPKTEAAVSGYAEAYGAGVRDDVRRIL